MRTAMLLAWRRLNNRWWDAAGRAAGFCMADCWQPTRAQWAPGSPEFRCWVLRKDHGRWHRSGGYKWLEGGQPIYDPLPVSWYVRDREGPVPGVAPRWLAGRHYAVPRRELERLAFRRAVSLRWAAQQMAAFSAQCTCSYDTLASAVTGESGTVRTLRDPQCVFHGRNVHPAQDGEQG